MRKGKVLSIVSKCFTNFSSNYQPKKSYDFKESELDNIKLESP